MNPATAAVVLGCMAMAFGLRVLPRLALRDFGVDTWYFLSYARAWRRDRRWPVRLPLYALDHPEQVYPPGLPWLLSWWSPRRLERSHWWINAAIDAVHCGLLCGVVWLVSGSLVAVAVAGSLFATSPVLVSHATELNARPLGGVLFSCFMLGLWGFERLPDWPTAAAVLLTGMAILWTHKMTAQQMAAALASWSVAQRDPRYLLLGAGMVLLSLGLSRGWYLKLLKGHWEIVRFWARHLQLLGAHQVYESPIYRNADKARLKRGVTGLRASRLHRWLAVGHLALIAVTLTGAAFFESLPAGPMPAFLGAWTLLVFVTAGATQWIPGLKQFGEGFRYLRYGVFAWSLLLGWWVAEGGGGIGGLAVAGVVVAQLVVSLHALRAQRRNSLAMVDGDMRAVLSVLAREPEDGVLALPVTHSEAIAYFAEKRVLWGAHGVEWDHLGTFFPVVREPIEAFLRAYGLRWLWVDTRYVDVEDLGLAQERLKLRLRQGPICLFGYHPSPGPAAAAEGWAVSARAPVARDEARGAGREPTPTGAREREGT